MYPYVGYISLELYKMKPQNFVDRYITPYLSFYYDETGRIREISSKEISAKLRSFLKKQKYKERFNLTNLMVVENSMGHTKADIHIGIISSDHKKALKAIREIETAFATLKGLKYYGDNVKVGTDEIKLTINSYGEELGITQKYLGNYVSNLYLSKKVGTLFDGNELLEIKIKSINYEDNLESLKNLEIPLKNSHATIRLKDVCDFTKTKSLERLIKDDGETTFYVFANVNASILTASEALNKIMPVLKEIEQNTM
ncbi:MAG: efflux RND transporter permease subunit [Epsilonproteobacteria bacterium]|nr:efflux RND transporter permease subunit [Campylobacterota bacterium]